MPGISASPEKPLPETRPRAEVNAIEFDQGVADDEEEHEEETESHDTFTNESGYPLQNDILKSSISTSANKSNYEFAVMEIEQEKQMVAALKRLSIGHMMTYDPDLPMDDLEYQYQFQQLQQQQLPTEDYSNRRFSTGSFGSGSSSPTRSPKSKSASTSPVNESTTLVKTPSIKNNSPSRTHSLSKHPSISRKASITRHNSISRKNSLKATLHTRNSSRNSLESNDEFFDAQMDEPLDTNSLLWVPANLHPEVDPEQFKKHIKHQVEEILERKVSKSNNRSKRSSLASITLPESSSTEELTHVKEIPTPDNSAPPDEPSEPANTPGRKVSPERQLNRNSVHENRFSNPSLRDLTNELETLSKLAGMDSNDALTLARTLSSASLGFTDVEKQAIDELNNSPPHTAASTSPRKNEASAETLFDPESPTGHKTAPGFRSPQIDSSPLRNKSISGAHSANNHSQQQSNRHLQHQLARSFEQSQRNYPTYQPDSYSPCYQQQQSQYPSHHNNHPYNNVQTPISKQKSNEKPHHNNYQQHSHSSSQRPPHSSSSHSQDTALKRSRRLDYRKQHSNSNPALGSQLQHNKAGKLAELRNNLNSGDVSLLTQQEPQLKTKLRLKNKTANLPPHPRSSQMLFSYRNPATDVSNGNSSRDSPYGSASSHGPLDQMNAMKYNHSSRLNKVRPESPTSPTDYSHQMLSLNLAHGNDYDYHHQPSGRRAMNNSYRDKSLPEKPYNHSGRQSPTNIIATSSPSKSKSRQNLASESRKAPVQTQKTLHQPYVTTPGLDSNGPISKNDKSKQLNQNLDLLRSEINEFKESLSKTEPPRGSDAIPSYPASSYQSPTSRPEDSPGSANESDFSFEVTYQDISYEDSLGIEQEVLRELNDEAEVQRQNDLKAELRKKFENSMRANEVEDYSKEEKEEIQPVHISLPELEQTEVPSSSQPGYDFDGIQLEDSNAFYEGKSSSSQIPNEFQNRHYNPEFRPQHQNEQRQKAVHQQPAYQYQPNPKSQPQNEVQSNYKLDLQFQQQQYNNLHEYDSIDKTEPIHIGEDYHSLSSDAEISPKKQRQPREQSAKPIVDRSLEDKPLTQSTNSSPIKKTLKKKKSWPWLKEKERSASMSSIDPNNLPPVPDSDKINTSSPTRSVSTPEISQRIRTKDPIERKQSPVDIYEPEVQNTKERKESTGKENVITKFFKRKRSGSTSVFVGSHHNSQKKSEEATRDFNHSGGSIISKSSYESGVTVDYESDNDNHSSTKKKSGGLFKLKQRHGDKDDKISSLVKSVSMNSMKSDDYDTHDDRYGQKRISLDHEGIKERKTLDISPPEANEYEQNSLLPFTVDELQQQQESKHLSEKSPETEKPDDQVFDIVLEDTKETKKDKKKSRLKRAKEEREFEKKRAEEERKERKDRKDRRKQKKSSKQMKSEEMDEKEEVEEKSVVMNEEDQKSIQSTLEVQEKLKKSIKRTSRANQPIEFTDSAFGFPLPPPSQSTLVMLDYRFPVHVERAIYRLSHLKLANPKRSLREQVLLSNFMYAYLNLVDHTLHLEQQMNTGAEGQNGEQDGDQFDTSSTFDEDIIINEADEVYEDDADKDMLDINQETITIDLNIANDEIKA